LKRPECDSGSVTAAVYTDIGSVEEEWQEFISRCESDHPFNSYYWLKTWWKHFGGEGPAIIVVRQLDKLVCCLPTTTGTVGVRGKGSFFRHRRLWVNTHSFRSGILCDRDVPQALHRAIDCLLTLADWDSLDLFYLPGNPGVQQNLKQCLASSGLRFLDRPGMQSPFLHINGSWDDFVNSLSKRRREAERRKSRKLCDKLGARIEIKAGKGAGLDEALNDCWKISRQTWKKARGSAIGSSTQLQAFYRDIASAPDDWLVLGLLYLNNEPIAFEYNLLYQNTLYNLKLGYSLRQRQLSPGQVLRFRMLEWAFDNGVECFDYMGNEAEYKSRFSNGALPHETVHIFSRSLRGRLLALYRLRLMSTLRRLKRRLTAIPLPLRESGR